MNQTFREFIVTAFPIAMIYFCGWVFIAEYLNRFGIDTASVELSLPSIMFYSVNVLKYPITWVILLLTIVTSISFMVLVKSAGLSFLEQRAVPSFWLLPAVVMLAVILLLLSIVSWYVAIAASDAAEQRWEDAGESFLVVTNSANPPDSIAYRHFLACEQRRGFTKIFSTPELLFLLCKDSELIDRGSVYAIRSDVTLMYMHGVNR